MLLKYLFLLLTTLIFCNCQPQLILKRFMKENCKFNPCLNGGTCIPGRVSCQCTFGWMGRYCHRHCRNIYKSCERWAMEDKCEQVRTQTNFFDVNCAVSCNQCIPDPKHILSDIPIPPSLEPLQFMVGQWHSVASKGLRYPTDMNSNGYEELLDVVPAEVPMFGTPSFNFTHNQIEGMRSGVETCDACQSHVCTAVVY